VDSWQQVTLELLRDVLKQNRSFNYERLYMDYWKELVWSFRPVEAVCCKYKFLESELEPIN
jgi:hypothetical protein